ncbi:MAG: hypothetical protein HC888_07160, partial [Candidatus Competibacteraceae bacterium]|nr:hypothetical protein [Candidatus Competibacteraceae bacterium]
MVSTDASARGIILLPKAGGQGMYVCAEPSPDVAMAAVAKMIAEVKTQNPAIDVKTQLEFQNGVWCSLPSGRRPCSFSERACTEPVKL